MLEGALLLPTHTLEAEILMQAWGCGVKLHKHKGKKTLSS